MKKNEPNESLTMKERTKWIRNQTCLSLVVIIMNHRTFKKKKLYPFAKQINKQEYQSKSCDIAIKDVEFDLISLFTNCISHLYLYANSIEVQRLLLSTIDIMQYNHCGFWAVSNLAVTHIDQSSCMFLSVYYLLRDISG